MQADRTDAGYPSGPFLRSTHRGVLVVETENVRRMMRRFARLRERRFGTLAAMEREESDQLPEEGPAEQVEDDDGGKARPEADENASPDEEGQATGHPPNAG
jgi:hypothetical protein